MLEDFLLPLGFKHGDDYSLRGGIQPVGYSWTVGFTGKYLSAAARVRKALTSIRLPSGTWQQFEAKDPEGYEVAAYISGDKNEKQRSIEILGKKLKQAAEQVHANLSIYLIKKDGIISVGRRKLAWVKPKPDKTFEL